MLNVLRLIDEFGEADFAARTGLPFATIARTVGEAQRKGLLEQAGAAGWRVTELGQRFLNDLQALFLPERADDRQSGATPAV
jgi:oxygen-independent coproporphyrinogen-3 oxidase